MQGRSPLCVCSRRRHAPQLHWSPLQVEHSPWEAVCQSVAELIYGLELNGVQSFLPIRLCLRRRHASKLRRCATQVRHSPREAIFKALAIRGYCFTLRRMQGSLPISLNFGRRCTPELSGVRNGMENLGSAWSATLTRRSRAGGPKLRSIASLLVRAAQLMGVTLQFPPWCCPHVWRCLLERSDPWRQFGPSRAANAIVRLRLRLRRAMPTRTSCCKLLRIIHHTRCGWATWLCQDGGDGGNDTWSVAGTQPSWGA